MREILFRGKQVDNGEWIIGGLNQHFWDEKESAFIYDEQNYVNIVVPETVGQYTGLTDKNGEKIFEGDVLAEYEGEDQWFCYGIVEYDSERGQFYLADGRGHYASYAADEDIYGEEWNNLEIVGNIHDNPELLETIE